MPLAWEGFLARYGPMAHAIAHSLLRPPGSAEDVVQEALLALHRAAEREPGRFESVEHARNWFLRAVRNLACKTGERTAREEPLAHEPEARDGAEAARVRARQAALGRLLLELPADARDLIARRYLRHQTLAQVSRETGVPLSTLHDRERALLRGLRGRLDRLGEDLE